MMWVLLCVLMCYKWETKGSHMECKGNCGENGGITNRTAEKKN